MARHPIRVGRRAGRLPTKRRLLWRLRNTRDSALAHRWLDGLRGVEIGGAAHNAFGLDTINVDRTRDMVAQREAVIEDFRTSTSWKATRPLRAVSSLLGRGRTDAARPDDPR